MIIKEFLFTSQNEIGLGYVNRLYKRNSKHRNSMQLTLVSSRGYRYNLLPDNQLYLTLKYFQPKNKQEESSLNSFIEKIKEKGTLTLLEERIDNETMILY